MNQAIAALIGLAMLAGCDNGSVDEHNASVEQVAKAVEKATAGEEFVRPGKWASTISVDEISAPGMPPQLLAQMKGALGQEQKSESCLTPEQAKRPKADFFAGKNNDCRYDNFTMGTGKIDAKMRCNRNGISQVMEMAGTYAPETYTMSMKTNVEGTGAPGGMTMRMHVSAKRVGECTEKQS
ncbi:MAG: DUF3617 domain-containing protein [Sphingomicrobium sp.]